MRFDEIDTKMRVYETAHDRLVLPGSTSYATLACQSETRTAISFARLRMSRRW